MANSVEDALNRASADQRERAMQTIEEARRNIQSSHMQAGDISSIDASSVARNAQIIEEAKRTIPAETMQTVDTVSPPMATPPMHGRVDSTPVNLNPTTQSTIENIEQGSGNNYLNENAVDRALARQSQAAPQHEPPQQQDMER